jgi:hypothetical protein
MIKIFKIFGRFISIVVAIGVFIGFASLVGTVSETETVIGLILALLSGLGTCKLLHCFEE